MTNPGYLANVQIIMTKGGELLHHPEVPLPARQFAAALLAVDSAFVAEDYFNKEYAELQAKFLSPRKELRTAAAKLS